MAYEDREMDMEGFFEEEDPAYATDADTYFGETLDRDSTVDEADMAMEDDEITSGDVAAGPEPAATPAGETFGERVTPETTETEGLEPDMGDDVTSEESLMDEDTADEDKAA